MRTLSPLDIMSAADKTDAPTETETLKSDSRLVFEKMLVSKSGDMIPVEIQARKFNFNGKAVAFSIARDIDQRKQSEQHLRQSEVQFRAFFDNIAIGAAFTTSPNKPFTANRTLCKLLGYTKEELESKPTLESVKQFSHPDDYAAEMKLFERMASGETTSYRMEKRYIRKNSEQFWGDITTSYVRYEKGNLALAVTTYRISLRGNRQKLNF
ncbi:PAS domain S-box protein [candidate division KSB1 bacterium]|nr:PAS domain S-box protein [candidate division KSB1 bacterium]